MSGRGKKIREIVTIRASFDGGDIDDRRTMGGYPSIDDAVKEARAFYRDYTKTKKDREYYKNLEVSVCFDEFEYEDGNIWGEPTCLSIKDLKPRRRK